MKAKQPTPDEVLVIRGLYLRSGASSVQIFEAFERQISFETILFIIENS